MSLSCVPRGARGTQRRGTFRPRHRAGAVTPPEGIWTEMKGRLCAAGWLTAALSGVRMYSLRYGFRYRIRHSQFPPLTRVKPAFSTRCGKVPRRTPVGDHPLQEACEGKAACDDQMGLVMDGGGERSLAESPNPKTADHADQSDRLVHFPCPYVQRAGRVAGPALSGWRRHRGHDHVVCLYQSEAIPSR